MPAGKGVQGAFDPQKYSALLKLQFPYLRDKDFDVVYSPRSDDSRVLEFYPPGEPGAPDRPRPQALPIQRPGIEIFKPSTRPIDVLADYVSHYAVNEDAELSKLYRQFSASLDPAAMQKRYEYHRQNFGEQRPYESWLKSTGIPEMFRGYTFGQWENAERMYTPKQLQILDRVRMKLGLTPPKEEAPPEPPPQEMTDDEFDRLPKASKSRLRGDML
ncbi:MAG: hypothetical protein RLZ44_902 [Pseudomonadota bacterium]|jgi:hypothetical protein